MSSITKSMFENVQFGIIFNSKLVKNFEIDRLMILTHQKWKFRQSPYILQVKADFQTLPLRYCVQLRKSQVSDLE